MQLLKFGTVVAVEVGKYRRFFSYNVSLWVKTYFQVHDANRYASDGATVFVHDPSMYDNISGRGEPTSDN